LKDIQKQHVELRVQHLEDLTHAIIVFRRPSLLEPGREKAYVKKKQQEIRRILRKEALIRMHNKMIYPKTPQTRRRFEPYRRPPSQTTEPYPIRPDPKQWE
jgi:hypothetical protein